MIYKTDCTLPDELLDQIAEQGLDILPEYPYDDKRCYAN